MDGIDGIAASQAVLAGAAWLVFGGLFGIDTIYYFAGVIAFSSLGFLVHNWSPAKIFMGDVGSAFLGFTFAAMPLLAAKTGKAASAYTFTVAITFLWLFIFDTILTLIRPRVRPEASMAGPSRTPLPTTDHCRHDAQVRNIDLHTDDGGNYRVFVLERTLSRNVGAIPAFYYRVGFRRPRHVRSRKKRIDLSIGKC